MAVANTLTLCIPSGVRVTLRGSADAMGGGIDGELRDSVQALCASAYLLATGESSPTNP